MLQVPEAKLLYMQQDCFHMPIQYHIWFIDAYIFFTMRSYKTQKISTTKLFGLYKGNTMDFRMTPNPNIYKSFQ